MKLHNSAYCCMIEYHLVVLPFLHPPQDEENFVAKLGVTVELMNKNIFRELIFAETFMSSNLPLITAQLK